MTVAPEAITVGHPASATRARLPSIDALRGVAAFAVLIAHLPFSGDTRPTATGEVASSALPWQLASVLEHGSYGVHLFLLISGFCIHMAWARDSENAATVSFRQFWKRRLHRLYPPYFVTLLLAFAGLYVLHRVAGDFNGTLASRFGYGSTTQLVIDVVLLLVLAQNVNDASQHVGNGPFWTLALEEQLYALYFPLLWMRRRWTWTRILVVVGATTVVWRFVGTYFVTEPPILLLGPSRWFDWTLGALAVEAHLGRVVLPAWCRSGKVGVGLIGVALVVVHSPVIGIELVHVTAISDGVVAVAFFTLVNAACEARWAGPNSGVVARVFAWLGTFSYSLYLTHSLVIVAGKRLGMAAGLGTWWILLLRLVMAIGGGWLFYMLVERRFLNSSRRGVSTTIEPRASTPAGEAKS